MRYHFIARISFQQIFQRPRLTLRQFSQTVPNKDKHQLCYLDSYSERNWTKKTGAASFDRQYFPPTVFSRPRLTLRETSVKPFPINISIKYAHKTVVLCVTETKKTDAASFDRPYLPPCPDPNLFCEPNEHDTSR